MLTELRRIADGKATKVADLDPEVAKFLGAEFSPASMRETLFEPEDWEQYVGFAIDLLFPSPAGKAAAVERVAPKISKEALAALEAKFGADLLSGGAKATVDTPIRSLDQLLTNGKVPSVRGGEFNRWFDELSSAELDILWQNKAAREAIEARIRQPGGLHEWCMVCRAPDFKKWGVPMEEIQRFRTKTNELKWISPIDGKPGGHGGHASSTFHMN